MSELAGGSQQQQAFSRAAPAQLLPTCREREGSWSKLSWVPRRSTPILSSSARADVDTVPVSLLSCLLGSPVTCTPLWCILAFYGPQIPFSDLLDCCSNPPDKCLAPPLATQPSPRPPTTVS